MADITSANAIFTLNVPDVFGTSPQTLQGFATDDAFSTQEIEIGETMLGVDGIMSYAYLPYIIHMPIVFQADSLSIPNTMETWIQAETATKQKYKANATIVLPSLSKSYVFYNGVITRLTPTPNAKKYLGPQSYQIDWNYYAPQPYTALAALGL